jgi:hypothetical protein
MTRDATKLTETLTQATSRRGFLGRLTKLAGATAAGVAGLLAARRVDAGPTILCCMYVTHFATDYTICRHNKCPETRGGGRWKDRLWSYWEVSDCDECG